MLLTENIVQKIQNYDNLKKFKILTEKVTNICFRIILKSVNVKICIDVEEQEPYVILLFIRKRKRRQLNTMLFLTILLCLVNGYLSLVQVEKRKNLTLV